MTYIRIKSDTGRKPFFTSIEDFGALNTTVGSVKDLEKIVSSRVVAPQNERLHPCSSERPFGLDRPVIRNKM